MIYQITRGWKHKIWGKSWVDAAAGKSSSFSWWDSVECKDIKWMTRVDM